MGLKMELLSRFTLCRYKMWPKREYPAKEYRSSEKKAAAKQKKPRRITEKSTQNRRSSRKDNNKLWPKRRKRHVRLPTRITSSIYGKTWKKTGMKKKNHTNAHIFILIRSENSKDFNIASTIRMRYICLKYVLYRNGKYAFLHTN